LRQNGLVVGFVDVAADFGGAGVDLGGGARRVSVMWNSSERTATTGHFASEAQRGARRAQGARRCSNMRELRRVGKD
jgi:hypothetical protein